SFVFAFRARIVVVTYGQNKSERVMCFSEVVVERKRAHSRFSGFAQRLQSWCTSVVSEQTIAIGESRVTERVIGIFFDRLLIALDCFLQRLWRAFVSKETTLKI